MDRAFPKSYGVFHVGSSITRKDYRDVDVRLILPDAEFERLFGAGDHHPSHLDFWFLVCWSVSEWMQKRTGLPVDFQIQAVGSKDNKDKGPRNALFFADPEPSSVSNEEGAAMPGPISDSYKGPKDGRVPSFMLRGGPGYDYPCVRTETVECALYECQKLWRCQFSQPTK